MAKVIDIQFMGIEFGFGSEEVVTGEFFVKVEGENGVNIITHRAQLQDTDLSDILPPEMDGALSLTGSLGNVLQELKKILILKVATDLGMEVADVGYVPTQSTKERIDQIEQAILELSMLIGGDV